MYRRTPEDKIFGVLNDFDLAKQAGERSPASFEITGTVPCMAIELLHDTTGKVRHLYRHDLESLGWAFLLVASEEVDSAGNITRHEDMRSWYTGNRLVSREKKSTLLFNLKRVIRGGLPLAARHHGDQILLDALAKILRWIKEMHDDDSAESRDQESYRTIMDALGFRENVD
jgi:hypothetical protein